MKNLARTIRLLALLAPAAMLGGCANEYFRVNPVLHHPQQEASTGNESANTDEKETQKKPIDLDNNPNYRALYERSPI